MVEILSLFVLCFGLALLVVRLLGLCGEYRRHKAEKDQMDRLMREQFLMQVNAMEAHRQMLHAAFMENSFWKDHDREEDESL